MPIVALEMLGVEVAAPDVGVTALDSSSQPALLHAAKKLTLQRTGGESPPDC